MSVNELQQSINEVMNFGNYARTKPFNLTRSFVNNWEFPNIDNLGVEFLEDGRYIIETLYIMHKSDDINGRNEPYNSIFEHWRGLSRWYMENESTLLNKGHAYRNLNEYRSGILIDETMVILNFVNVVNGIARIDRTIAPEILNNTDKYNNKIFNYNLKMKGGVFYENTGTQPKNLDTLKQEIPIDIKKINIKTPTLNGITNINSSGKVTLRKSDYKIVKETNTSIINVSFLDTIDYYDDWWNSEDMIHSCLTQLAVYKIQ